MSRRSRPPSASRARSGAGRGREGRRCRRWTGSGRRGSAAPSRGRARGSSSLRVGEDLARLHGPRRPREAGRQHGGGEHDAQQRGDPAGRHGTHSAGAGTGAAARARTGAPTLRPPVEQRQRAAERHHDRAEPDQQDQRLPVDAQRRRARPARCRRRSHRSGRSPPS